MKLYPARAGVAVLALAIAGGPALAQVSPAPLPEITPVPAPEVFPAPAPETLEVTLTAEQVIELQTLLAQLGFDPLGIDGVFGPATQAAVVAAQQSLGLLADGIPTIELLERLRVEAAAMPMTPIPAPVPGG